MVEETMLGEPSSMAINPSGLQAASQFCRSPRLLRLAVIAGWVAGKSSVERAHRSRWSAEDMDAAMAAALAFLELNQSLVSFEVGTSARA